jgi:hypothetical protein
MSTPIVKEQVPTKQEPAPSAPTTVKSPRPKDIETGHAVPATVQSPREVYVLPMTDRTIFVDGQTGERVIVLRSHDDPFDLYSPMGGGLNVWQLVLLTCSALLLIILIGALVGTYA